MVDKIEDNRQKKLQMIKTGGSLNRCLHPYEIPVGWVHSSAVGGFISFRWWHKKLLGEPKQQPFCTPIGDMKHGVKVFPDHLFWNFREIAIMIDKRGACG